MNTLIMGGTSGLGLEIAKRESEHSQVMVAGRHDPALDSDGSALGYASEFRAIDLARDPLNQNVEGFVATLPYVDNLVYAPGFYQEGHIDDLGDDEVDRMLNVCQRGLIFTVKKLLERQGALPELVTVTSTSQVVPRELESVYNAAKAGAAHFSNGISLDPRVGRTLVVAPSGMATPFWYQDGRNTDHMMDPVLVAEQIQALRAGNFDELHLHETDEWELTKDYSYMFAKILGKSEALPQRVEIPECR